MTRYYQIPLTDGDLAVLSSKSFRQQFANFDKKITKPPKWFSHIKKQVGLQLDIIFPILQTETWTVLDSLADLGNGFTNKIKFYFYLWI